MAGEGHVVLIHAFPLHAAQWRPQTVPPGWRLFTPDLPGFGASTSPAADSVETMAAGVEAAMDREGIGRAVIGGLSMGGYVALALYRRAPHRFRAMILADTRATPDTAEQRESRGKMIEMVRARGAGAVADELLPKLLGETTKRDRPQVGGTVRALIEANRPGAIAAALEALASRPDSTATLRGIDVPVLVVCGEEDVVTPLSDAEAMRLEVPSATLHVIPRAGHLANVEDPAAFNESLAAFLASDAVRTSP